MRWFLLACLIGYGSLPVILATSGLHNSADVRLLNVSYDPTRGLWADLNRAFVERYYHLTGQRLAMRMSHGPSGSQARAVIDGLDADVITLALWSDTNQLRKRGLLADDWHLRLPNRSLPYTSTLVFVVRKGNPLGIRDWPDIIRSRAAVITPNPKTSGNGRVTFLAAWGAALERAAEEELSAEQAEIAAREYVAALYRQAPILESGARAASVTFTHKRIGDVLLAWENEAHFEAEHATDIEVIYPRHSLLAEPYVAVVDVNVDRKHTRSEAQAYMEFLYTDDAQFVLSKHHYRPLQPQARRHFFERHSGAEECCLFPIQRLGGDWDDAQKRFFAENGVYDQISADNRVKR